MTDLREISITIPGAAMPEARPRVTRRGAYVPAKSRAWREAAQLYIRRALANRNDRSAVDGALWFPKHVPVLLQVIVFLPCPKTDHRKTRPVGRRKHVKENADGDNILKAVMDACTGVLWYGDGQVSTACIAKWIAAQGEEPCVQLVAMIDEVK